MVDHLNRAFIQRDENRPASAPAHIAAEGLAQLGYEVVWFNEADAPDLDITATTMVVGFIEVTREAVQRLTGKKPPVFNYPVALLPFARRRIWRTTVGDVRNHHEMWPVFMKPADDIKSFTGRVVSRVRDVVATHGLADDTPVFASDLTRFRSEFRCFIQRGEVIGCRHYKGDPLVFPNPDTIVDMVQAWKESPKAYCLDVGVIDDAEDGITSLVEVNDAYSAGTYGLDPLFYARFIETRWCDLTGSLPIP